MGRIQTFRRTLPSPPLYMEMSVQPHVSVVLSPEKEPSVPIRSDISHEALIELFKCPPKLEKIVCNINLCN
jgi:hypothetical protein